MQLNKEVASDLRKAVIDAITPLVVGGVTIPVKDSFLNPTVTPANYLGGQAYVLITDQIGTEINGNRCSPRQRVNLTIEIMTKFPAGYGGQLAMENISSLIIPMMTKQTLVMPPDWLIIDIKLFNQPVPTEIGTTQIAYRKLLRYSFDIWQVV
jgi:hypothetical protein